MRPVFKPTKKACLYRGEIKIDFFEDTHQYFRKDKKIVSVTGATGTVDKSGPLMAWAIRLMRDELTGRIKAQGILSEQDIEAASALYRNRRDDAGDMGNKIHAWCDQYIQAKLLGQDEPAIPDDAQMQNGAQAFLKWVRDYKVEFVASEMLVYSKKHDYVGLMDIKAKVEGKLAVCDLKTGNGVWPEMNMQVSAYREADTEESGAVYEDSWIIRLGKEDGRFYVKKRTKEEHKEDFKAFIGALTVKKYLLSHAH